MTELTKGMYAVEGKMGSGKSIWMVKRALQYLEQGRRVACNFDLNLEHLAPGSTECEVFRLPDIPTSKDFRNLGKGYDGEFQDDKQGAIFIDEAAIFMNTRDFANKDRHSLIKLFVLMRKLRWDVYIAIQNSKSLDNQIKDLVIEYYVNIIYMGKIKMPIMSKLSNLLTLGMYTFTLPDAHRATTRLGWGINALKIETEYFQRTDHLSKSYNTEQEFIPGENEKGIFQYIPPGKLGQKKQSNLQRIGIAFYEKTYNFFILGALLGYLFTNQYQQWTAPKEETKKQTTQAEKKKKEKEKEEKQVSYIITGSMFVNPSNCDYTFSDREKTVDLVSKGYSIRCIKPCQALVTKGSFKQVVYCSYPNDDGKAPKDLFDKITDKIVQS